VNDVPPDCPPGWHVGPPDFVGVGAARSGTRWWDSLIGAHPDVARPAGVPTDLHFFDGFWNAPFGDDDVSRYAAWFPRPDGAVAGEWTADYGHDVWTPPLLRRAAPDARLLVLLRDPVERFASGQRTSENAAAAGWTPRAAANDSFQRGLYAGQVERLWRTFPREQVLVIQYEHCVRNPVAQLRRTLEFLGLDPAPADGIVAASAPRRVSTPASAALSTEQRACLIDRYRDANRRLAGLVPDLDLSLWPDR